MGWRPPRSGARGKRLSYRDYVSRAGPAFRVQNSFPVQTILVEANNAGEADWRVLVNASPRAASRK